LLIRNISKPGTSLFLNYSAQLGFNPCTLTNYELQSTVLLDEVKAYLIRVKLLFTFSKHRLIKLSLYWHWMYMIHRDPLFLSGLRRMNSVVRQLTL